MRPSLNERGVREGGKRIIVCLTGNSKFYFERERCDCQRQDEFLAEEKQIATSYALHI